MTNAAGGEPNAQDVRTQREILLRSHDSLPRDGGTNGPRHARSAFLFLLRRLLFRGGLSAFFCSGLLLWLASKDGIPVIRVIFRWP